LSWRLAVRQAFSVAFDRGYEACDFRDGEYLLLPAMEPAKES
jgi:predicted GNAT superfamily acetyltransferase